MPAGPATQPEMVPEAAAGAKSKRRRPRPASCGGKYAPKPVSPRKEEGAAEPCEDDPATAVSVATNWEPTLPTPTEESDAAAEDAVFAVPPAAAPATITTDDNVEPSPLLLPSPAASSWATEAPKPKTEIDTPVTAATAATAATAVAVNEGASDHDRLRLLLEGEEDDEEQQAGGDGEGDAEDSDGACLPASPILVEVAALDGEEELLGALILECTVPLSLSEPSDSCSPFSSSSSSSSSASSSSSTQRSRRRSFTVVHEGRFYEVQTPDDAVPGEVINVVVMMPAAPKSTGSQRRLFEPSSGPASSFSAASASAATYVPTLAGAGAGAATPTCRGVASAAPFAASRVCSPIAAGSSSHSHDNSSSSSSSRSGGGVIAPAAALVLSKILDIVAAVNKRYRLSARLDKAKKAALSALRALNAKTRSADGLTLYDRLEALLFLCARRLGSLVSVAVQVERELAVGRWVSKRAGVLRCAVEPLLGAAVGGLRRLDEGVLGGRAGKAAARVLPAGFVGYLHGCGRDGGCGDGDGFGDDEEEEAVGGWAGAREGRLALAAAVTPQLTRVQVRGSGGGSGSSGSSGGRCATARLVQTPIRALVFSPPSK